MAEHFEYYLLKILLFVLHLSYLDMAWLCGAFTCFVFVIFFQKSPLVAKKTVSEIRIRGATGNDYQDVIYASNDESTDQATFHPEGYASNRTFEIASASSTFTAPANPAEPPAIPVRIRRTLLDAADQKFFHALSDIGHQEFYVIPNVPLSRIVSLTEKSVSVQLLKRLRSHGLQFILVDQKTLKVLVGISLPLNKKQSLIFESQVLGTAKLPHLVLSRDVSYSISDLEGLVRAKLMPPSARLIHANPEDQRAVGFS